MSLLSQLAHCNVGGQREEKFEQTEAQEEVGMHGRVQPDPTNLLELSKYREKSLKVKKRKKERDGAGLDRHRHEHIFHFQIMRFPQDADVFKQTAYAHTAGILGRRPHGN